jgi:type I restriction enzyme R subunit
MTTEADARIIVDRLLREAGWNLEDKTQVLTEEAAAGGEADYVLLDRRGRPLAVVEAKRFSKDPYSARQRALDYANGLKAPFIFLSNGETTYFWDYAVADARQVAAFFSRNDLERIATLRTFRKPLGALPIPDVVSIQGDEKQVRPHQRECIQTIDNAIEAGKRRLLIRAFGLSMQHKLEFRVGFDAANVGSVLSELGEKKLREIWREETGEDLSSELLAFFKEAHRRRGEREKGSG